ncbi:hypothetical protein AALO_G00130720 [Alosa alosa]|uniref:Uncharacterized protein n=1 Tax=Alosa alosa TaxID=278164 RepID=A0AAV6GM99_9TELE|nr:hypothetical protein AALO_G00130720 [Alosa alosa]
MYSKYRYQDDILSQLHFLCTDPEYRWKTATCILSLVVILSWLLGRWRQEDEDCCDPDSDLLMYLSSQINTLDTECLNSEELLKEITANIVNCTARKKAHKHDAYSTFVPRAVISACQMKCPSLTKAHLPLSVR